MSRDFVLNKDTYWEVDLSDDTKVKLKTTLCCQRLVVEMLEIEVTISTDGSTTNRFRTIHAKPDPSDTMTLEVTSNDIAKLYSELFEYLDRLNKEF